MQVKKDYTQERIVEEARRIFLKKGFVKASMRDIANAAGIGVSNLYNYFTGKDELFRYIVQPLLTKMDSMVRMHNSDEYNEQFLSYATGESDEMLVDHVQTYLQLISRYRDELRLLLFKAQGSSLENFIDDYTDECTRLVVDFMDDFKAKYPQFSMVKSPFTYHIHTVWMFSFISEIVKHELKPKEIEKAIEDYILFEYTGWRRLLNQ